MLNKRLRALRENSNLTQKDASEIFDISRERYNQYETGKRKPDYDTLITFADYFHVTTDYLLGRSDQLQQNKTLTSQPISNKHITPNEENLLRIFRKLHTESYQEKAIDQFKGYVDCFVEIEASSGNLGKDAQSTPSKKNVG